jgi:hypothetical protein
MGPFHIAAFWLPRFDGPLDETTSESFIREINETAALSAASTAPARYPGSLVLVSLPARRT